MSKGLTALVFLAGVLLSSQAWATGEVLRLDPYGVRYCEHSPPFRITPDNTESYWIKIDSPSSISVYLDPALTQPAFVIDSQISQTLPAEGSSTPTDRVWINGRFLVDDKNYLIINGWGLLNKAGSAIKFLRTNYIRSGLSDDCSVSGHMLGKRVK